MILARAKITAGIGLIGCDGGQEADVVGLGGVHGERDAEGVFFNQDDVKHKEAYAGGGEGDSAGKEEAF